MEKNNVIKADFENVKLTSAPHTEAAKGSSNFSEESLSAELSQMIEDERKAFIKVEYGRLAAVMGTEYWDSRTKSPGVFHGVLNELTDLVSKKIAEPYELSIEELAMLHTLDKVVERMGTTSYMAFYSMYPEDIERVALLAEINDSIKNGRECRIEALDQLYAGHEAYLSKAAEDDVKIIM